MSEQLPEVVDQELESVPAQDIQLNQSKLTALIAFSEQTDKLGKALDRIRTFVLSRALPGDFLRFGDKLEMSGPASERILSALGLMGVQISFEGWGYKKDTGIDKLGDHYTWWYFANVEIGGLRLGRIEGRASSRDKFFGRAQGAWKDLSEVKESDVRMAARRGVFKEAIKVALGLRGLPFESAASLGLDPTKIKTVEFGSGGNTEASAPAAPAGTALLVKSVTMRTINKKDGTKSSVYVIEDERGTKYETFSESIAKAAKALKEAGKKAVFDHEANGKYAPKLKALVDVGDAGSDAQEPE